ncbi:MerR family transcriptional regulator [Tannerella forsythia]|uniref:MerR family transcriptional regulator n=1 Tax=Tannerella forsythia TaxID=28112 RepID=A0A3P1Z2X9_TANFO|nr:MerR family transcriptional regulator [Tannerella forsythia]RRD77305.1 MerR family transcriptional regulator [Tannerella forsythia]
MALKQEKVEKLYFSIGEVAHLFGLNESTLRFWEKEFDEISPRKTKKGTRYYRQEDIEQIRLIYHLVKERGMTLSGARRRLKDNKEATVRLLEISDRLKGVRAALVSMIEALNEAEKEQENKKNNYEP